MVQLPLLLVRKHLASVIARVAARTPQVHRFGRSAINKPLPRGRA
jgi:hypothetical protein